MIINPTIKHFCYYRDDYPRARDFLLPENSFKMSIQGNKETEMRIFDV